MDRVSQDIGESIARNARTYDAIPYTSKPFSQTHPVRLAGIAKMFGIDAAPMKGARVLELGCASGGNLIPHAVHYPEATFVGCDISPRQVEDAKARIAQLGLTNIEVHCKSLTEIGPENGTFDYIITHGVYSWIPEEVQQALLRVCRQNLSDIGIAYVSYNVLPGWRVWQSLRDAFQLMIPPDRDAEDRVAMARDFMTFMRDYTPDGGPYGEVLRGSFERLKDLPDDYIAHEYLENSNIPLSFRDFIDQAGAQGLGYLGEADFYLMFPENYGQKFAAEVLDRTARDIVSVEQMLDVMTGRTFRQTLLIAEDRLPAIKRQVTPGAMVDIHYLPQQGTRIEKSGDEARMIDKAGRMVGSNRKSVHLAMQRLLAAYPGSITLDECAMGMTAQERAEVADALFKLTIFGIVHPCSEAIRIGKVSARPKAARIGHVDALSGLTETVNLRHDPVKVDPVSLVLLRAMDGSKSLKDLERTVLEAARNGEIHFTTNGAPIREERILRSTIQELAPKMLESLQTCALIEP